MGIRSDNGSEFFTKHMRKWLNKLRVKTLFIEPGSTWEKGYIELQWQAQTRITQPGNILHFNGCEYIN
jgi:transposase InsO family protein